MTTSSPPPRPVISPVLAGCLRIARARAALSPEELAQRLGLTVDELTANEEGTVPLGDVQIEEWARALKSTPWAILSLALLDADQITAAVGAGTKLGEVRILPFVVRKTIERMGVSQVSFSAPLGINQSTVNRWCSGAMALSEEILATIATTFGKTTEQILIDALTYEDPALERAKGQLRDAFTVWLRARYVAAVETKRVVPAVLAEKLGVNRSALTRFASGTTLSTPIAHALHLELDRLIPVAHLLGIAPETEATAG